MFYNFLCDNLQEPSTNDIILSRFEKEIPYFRASEFEIQEQIFTFP